MIRLVLDGGRVDGRPLAEALADRVRGDGDDTVVAWWERPLEPYLTDPQGWPARLRSPRELLHLGFRLTPRAILRRLQLVRGESVLLLPSPGVPRRATWLISAGAGVTTVGVLRAAGSLPDGYRHPSGAWAELGFRALPRGLLAHHDDALLRPGAKPPPDLWSPRDLRRWARRCHGRAGVVLARWPLPGEAEVAPTTSPPRFPVDDAEADGVDVVVATLGRPRELVDLLDDLSAQTSPPRRVVVVEQRADGSPRLDATALAARRDPFSLVHLLEDGVGASRARNRGLLSTAARWIAFLDDDVRLEPGFLASVLDELDAVPGASGTGVRALAPGEPAGPPTEPPRLAESLGSGRALVLRRAVLEVGGFDEAIEGWGEDFELGLRLQLAGHTLLESRRCHLVHLAAPRGGFRTRLPEPDRPRPAPTLTYRWLRWLPPAMLRGTLLRHVAGSLPRGPRALFVAPALRRSWRRSRALARETLAAGPRLLRP